jgi:hypothetical protein
MDGRVALFKLGSQEGKGFADGPANIYSAGQRRCSGSEPAKTPDEIIDSRNLSDYDLGKVFAKLFVVVPLGKEFRKCSYRHERILDFMSHT